MKAILVLGVRHIEVLIAIVFAANINALSTVSRLDEDAFSNAVSKSVANQRKQNANEAMMRVAGDSRPASSDVLLFGSGKVGVEGTFTRPKTILAVWHLAQQATTQSPTRAPDTQEFLNLEEAIRTDYVENHPFSLSTYMPPVMAKQLNEKNVTTQMKFSMEVSQAVHGKLNAKAKGYKKPSFLQMRAAEMIMGLPHSDELGLAIMGLNGVGQNPAGAIDKLANENLQNFKRIVATYGGISVASTFDTDPPPQQTQAFLSAFKTFAHEDVQFPNVYTVWVEDFDNYKDEEYPDRASYSRSLLSQLAGKYNVDDAFYDNYSREHKTDVLHRALLHFIDVADKVSHDTNNDGMMEYAKMSSTHFVTIGSTMALKDYFGHEFTDRDSILAVFGKEALEKFDKEPDQAKKSATARAALIMRTCEMRVVFPMLVAVE